MAAPMYDFDVHEPGSFMYYFTKQYMDATYQAIASLGRGLQGKTVYDIGIGRGRSLALLKSLGAEKVIGYDVSEAETRYVQGQMDRLGLDVSVVIDTFGNDKLKEVAENSADAVTLMNILFCVPDDSTRTTLIQEVKRILKPNGLLIVVDMQKLSLFQVCSLCSGKPWKFRTRDELIRLMSPLALLTSAPSNHFYFVNSLMDGVNRLCGANICYALERLFRALGVPPSTKTFVFTKV